jgi:hypothetical protein
VRSAHVQRTKGIDLLRTRHDRGTVQFSLETKDFATTFENGFSYRIQKRMMTATNATLGRNASYNSFRNYWGTG